MNGVSLSNKVIHWNPKDFAVSRNFNKVIRENEKVSNNYHWKSNKADGVDCFGRTPDLTSLINKPDGSLQGMNKQNQTYLDYRADIPAIKNYESMEGNGLLEAFNAKYVVDGKTIRTAGVILRHHP